MRSPWQCDLQGLIALLSPGDDLLLLQDGVLAAIEGSQCLTALLQSPATLYVLQEDITARGLGEKTSASVQLTDYTGFVNLTLRHPQQFTW